MSPKKSETIEVRIAHQAKTAFAARCRENGLTVSEALRGFMEREIGSKRRSIQGMRGWHVVAAMAAGLALGAVAAPSLAQTQGSHGSRAAFERLDLNRDGLVSYAEFRR